MSRDRIPVAEANQLPFEYDYYLNIFEELRRGGLKCDNSIIQGARCVNG